MATASYRYFRLQLMRIEAEKTETRYAGLEETQAKNLKHRVTCRCR